MTEKDLDKIFDIVKKTMSENSKTIDKEEVIKIDEPIKTEKPKKEKAPRKKYEISSENKEKMLENLKKGREARKGSGMVKSAKAQDVIMKELSELKAMIKPAEKPVVDVVALQPIGSKEPKPVVEKPVVEKPVVIEKPVVVEKPVEKPVVVEKPVIIKPVIIKQVIQPKIYSLFNQPKW
jgi:hypothetical protein